MSSNWSLLLFVLDKRGDIGLSFLWLNVVGALAAVLEWVLPKQPAN